MTAALLVTLAAACGPSLPASVGPVGSPLLAPSSAQVATLPADTLPARLYDGGMAFADFLEATNRRRETWHANYARAEVFADLAGRARAVPGSWRLLVVAVDACGDSANTIPYLARFVEAVDGLEIRVVEPSEGGAVMEAHPTPDGRGATPTVVVLDAEGRDVGCWVERPAGIQSWWLANPEGLSTPDKLTRKYAWYDADAGYHTILEVVETIEAAARGERVCGRPADPEAGFPAAGPGEASPLG